MLFDEKLARIEDAQHFFDLIFGRVHETKFSYLWTLPDKQIYPFDVSDANARRRMAEKAIDLADDGSNVFYGVHLADEPPKQGERVKADNVTMQAVIVADIDIEGGKHQSGEKRKYPASFDVAKDFLPFEVSLLVSSGYGLHAYIVLDEPIKITSDNRNTAQHRNNLFIETIRTRAGEFSKAVDSVGDLARVLRVPGTLNYKLGVDETAPNCYTAEENQALFAPVALDDKFDSLILAVEEKQDKQQKLTQIQEKSARPARTPYDDIFNSPEYNIFRAELMLDVLKTVNHKDLSYGRWLAINTACKNIGVDYAVVGAFNQCEPSNYNAEQNLRRWQKLNAPSFDIQTLHGIAKDFGYREGDAQKAYRKARPDLFRNPNIFSDDEYKFYFSDDRADLTNGRRLENFCGDSVRWITDDEQWLTWQNGLWTRGSEKNSAILPFAAKLYDILKLNAKDKDAVKTANSFKNAGKANAAITWLKSCDSILITADDLDNHPNLLNCLNGVVDLKDGKFYSHVAYRDRMLTQQVRADFNPNVQSDLVEKFFRDIQPDDDTRAGLLRWLGYNLTGEVSEERYMIHQGSGANGKGTLSKTILHLLGSYATGLPSTALLRNRKKFDANVATTALNALEKARFAISEELPLDSEIDSALIKNLSGGDDINLRHNYGEYRTIKATAKINLSGNFLPRIENDDDKGLLRRALNMPYTQTFGDLSDVPADKDLKKKLLLPENLSALFALLVREAVIWYNGGGLIISDIMKAETKRHFAQNAFVVDFIEENYEYDDDGYVRAKDLIDALRSEYPRECARYKRADLIQRVANIEGITYITAAGNVRMFKGIKKFEE